MAGFGGLSTCGWRGACVAPVPSGQNDRCLKKHCLPATSLAGGKYSFCYTLNEIARYSLS